MILNIENRYVLQSKHARYLGSLDGDVTPSVSLGFSFCRRLVSFEDLVLGKPGRKEGEALRECRKESNKEPLSYSQHLILLG
jgi:hypothetical protein